MANQKPEKVYRLGNVSASVFVNEVETENGKRRFRNVNVQRSYKDGDEWKQTNSLAVGDIANAIEVLKLAYAHVAAKEADVTEK